MRTFLVIAADQEKLGAAAGAHTFTQQHLHKLQRAAGKRATVIAATPEEAREHLKSAEIIAAFPRRMPRFAEIPRVKWMHSFSAGVDELLTPEIIASKVLVSNSSGIHAVPIAEHILGFTLAFTRGFPGAYRNQIDHHWKKVAGITELRGSTVLIVGLGAIGNETARLCHALGAHVHAIARSTKKKPNFVQKLSTTRRLEHELGQADFVVITLPYTKETHHLFNRATFRCMRKSAVVINIGRGSIIEEKDLVDALRTGDIAGAALDVTETEPLPKTSPLWDMENVIITPHQSGLSGKYMDRAVDLLCKNIKAYLSKKTLPTLVSKKLGY